jgi:hypothetical protein
MLVIKIWNQGEARSGCRRVELPGGWQRHAPPNNIADVARIVLHLMG